MKRYRDLFDSVIAFENLYRAFRLAARGKQEQPEVVAWRYGLEGRLLDLQERLLAESYRFGPYCAFMVLDPKPRHIVAAPFEDRIVHHAVCNILEPIFERTFIFDSYACRKGKGTHPAVFRLQEFMRSAPGGHVLQCDVRKYFQSVDHAVLKGLIRRKVKDHRLLRLMDSVIDSSPANPEVGPGRGLPIGNLTSQLYANVYLDPLDHFVKEQLRGHRYVRYVDDCAPRRRSALEGRYGNIYTGTKAKAGNSQDGPGATLRGLMLCCTGDGGWPLGLGLQDQGPNHRKLLRHNGRGGERFGKGAARLRQVSAGKANVSEPLSTCRKCIGVIETRLQSLAWDKLGGSPAYWPSGDRHQGGASPVQALVRNVGTCRLDAKGEAASGRTVSARVPTRGEGADRPVVVMKLGNASGAKGPNCPANAVGQPARGGSHG